MPVVASITSSGVTPRKAQRRYVVACSVTSGSGPNSPTSGPDSAMPTTVVSTPMTTASQTPSMPWASAPRVSPAPMRRATEAVVPYARKMHNPTAVCTTAPAMPRPASSGVPRWPTIDASASRKSGSATSARNAGTASRRISRSGRVGVRDGTLVGSPVTAAVYVGKGQSRSLALSHHCSYTTMTTSVVAVSN